MEQLEHGEWHGNTDGMPWMHRMLKNSFKYLNLRFVYLGMAIFAVPFYMVFSHQGYISMYRYFRRRRGCGVCRSFLNVYRNHYRFGQVILDRFATYAGEQFHFDLEGYDRFQELSRGSQGFIILSCHVGNYELAGYAFRAEKRYNALIYSGEAKEVMENRNRILSKNNIRMIPVSADMSHIYVMNEALSEGEILSIPADRIFGSSKYVECSFMGSPARFPLGPFAMALQRGLPTLAIFVMKTAARRYKVYIREITATAPPSANRQARATCLAQAFAREVESVLDEYPEQWFNYYDFWNHDR